MGEKGSRGPAQARASGRLIGHRLAILALVSLCLFSPFQGSQAGPAPGTFVMVIGDNPDNLNPYLHSLAASGAVYRFTFDSLYTWTFRLRPGVRWSDGAPFTSADVKFAWQLATNRDVHITYATGFDKIASIDTPDPLTVVYRLKEPYAPFRDQVMGSAIVPQHVLGSLAADQINRTPFNQKPVGTGPFYVSEFVTDDHVTLTANPHYWGKPARLQRIIVRIVPDQNTQVNLLKAGELNLLNVPAARLQEIARVPTLVVKRYLDPTYALVQLDEYEFLREGAVRQALDYATPKESIIRNVMKGSAISCRTAPTRTRAFAPARTIRSGRGRCCSTTASRRAPAGFSTRAAGGSTCRCGPSPGARSSARPCS
ncbi:MAG: hypothetical protein E6H03_06240 [Bacillati bacterium ANGP1]|uniref:Solute-binding protein family 5 domain-containing protein n=1 Tax=Candidatus Segetimicrobium genomatis TaxID=2569760 RepID=A0A537JEM9_9BACT|nr:MAG: hypothetical protein E6H03_06240 [Terrabacteria group bacterium ANGP1]